MLTGMTFDLDGHLDRLIEAGESDPWTLVKKILAELDDDTDALRDVAEKTLPTYVYRHIGHRRAGAAHHGGTDSRARASGRSAVGALIRAGEWRRELQEPYPVGQGAWKRLGAMTAPELDYAARLRERQAQGALMNAARLRELREALIRNGKGATVASLSAEVLSGIFDRAA